MCGISGFSWQDETLINAMNDAIRHRGPDAEGVFCDPQVSLGHRRLSILDLSEKGAQPMTLGRLEIVYNGEIYNFRHLREELQAKGRKFASDTDTEVVLHAYDEWGEACVERFNGMWAFCIYDREDGTLFLSRDRFGIKPLYYYSDGKRFIFASELKAIRQHAIPFEIDPKGLNFFFYQKYIGDDLTIYQGVRKLRPSENLRVDLKTGEVIRSKYYDLEREVSRCAEMSEAERLKAIESLVADAVEKRLIADVPVGSFLSGGLDSSLISALIARNNRDFKTFSIGFREKSYDELPYSKMVAEYIGTDHHTEYLEIDEALICEVVGKMDEPFGDSSVLPTYLLSQLTRKQVTVSLSGDAGDEVFCGYDSYMAHRIARFIPYWLVRCARVFANLLPPSEKKLSLTFKMQKFLNDFAPRLVTRHMRWMATLNDPERSRLLGKNFVPSDSLVDLSGGEDLLDAQLNDFRYYLPENILKKVDMASMLNSLEARVPFLDHRLVPLVLSLPNKYKIRGLTTKWLLKKIAAGFLPRKITHRPKKGFSVPISRWIKESALIGEYLTDERYFQHGLLDRKWVGKMLNAHHSAAQDNARPLWLVFVFNYWWFKNHGT